MTGKWRWIGLGAIVLIGAGIVFFGGGDSDGGDTVTARVAYEDLTRVVSVSGTIMSAQDASLSFGQGGSVATLRHRVGDLVSSGETIASLRNTSLLAEKQEAESSLAAAQAELDKLNRGATDEDRALADAKVEKATQTREEYIAVLARELREALTVAEDTVFNKVDQTFSNARSFPQLKVFGVDSAERSTIETGRRQIEGILQEWRNALFGATDEVVIENKDIFVGYINTLNTFLGSLANALAGASSGGTVSDSTIASWQSDIATGRTAVDASRAAVLGAAETLAGSVSALEVAKRERDITYKSASPEDLAVQVARVQEATARVARVSASIQDTLLIAPFTGVLGSLNLSVGENVSAYAVVATIESSGALQIEAYIPEVDIALLEKGLSAEVTLDAIGSDEIFSAHVVSIDGSATVREGVATYKTILEIDRQDARIRPGMSANVDVLAATRQQVLVVPGRSVSRREGKDYVKRVLPDGLTEEVLVTTGLRGTFGDVEILSGLAEGDVIIVRE